MRYVSTRGAWADNPQPFSAILLEGLATDGGLAVPQKYPSFTLKELEARRVGSRIADERASGPARLRQARQGDVATQAQRENPDEVHVEQPGCTQGRPRVGEQRPGPLGVLLVEGDRHFRLEHQPVLQEESCLLYTSDAADE